MRVTGSEWSALLAEFPQAHVLQGTAWGELKSRFGWQIERLSTGQTHAQVLFKRLPLGFSIGYIPKGPLGEPDDAFWNELARLAAAKRAIFIRLEPDLFESTTRDPWPARQDLVTARPIQPAQTIVLNLRGSEEEILARMKQKTRYNIHLAEKKEIEIVTSADVAAFHQMMLTTGSRDGFGIHSLAYYQQAFSLHQPGVGSELLFARYQGNNLAGVMLFKAGKRCWYFYGASTNDERNRMPVYLLQWEAIRWARQAGCEEYDLWGIPDAPEEALEEQFANRADGLWGVYRFKRGFGGRMERTACTVDLVSRPLLYRLVTAWLSRGRGGAGLG
jgi:lipid II:glycine glycyltransferase (peptidoglycan interpeptide bridge formation enzyme)